MCVCLVFVSNCGPVIVGMIVLVMEFLVVELWSVASLLKISIADFQYNAEVTALYIWAKLKT